MCVSKERSASCRLQRTDPSVPPAAQFEDERVVGVGRGQELQQARFDLACPGLPALAIEPRELRVTGALKNSQLVEIPGAAHVQSFRHESTRTMMRDFYNTPGQKADVSCLKSIPPLRFVTDVKAISR
jgi:hypothetical protein